MYGLPMEVLQRTGRTIDPGKTTHHQVVCCPPGYGPGIIIPSFLEDILIHTIDMQNSCLESCTGIKILHPVD